MHGLTCTRSKPTLAAAVLAYAKQILPRLNTLIFPTLAAGILVAVTIQPANALTIIREYIPPSETFKFDGLQASAGKAPTNTVGGGNLVDVFNAAADAWEQAIRDDHTITIQFGWSPIPVGNGVHNVRFQGGTPNRVMDAVVYFDNDGSTVWFLDPNPAEHSEFPTAVKCYTVLGKEQVNSGIVLSDDVDSPQALDLLTIAKHEIGHALGLSPWNDLWATKYTGEGITMNTPRPFLGSVIPIDAEGHIRLHGALMNRFLLPGQRTLISAVDILAIAEMGEFTDLNLNPEHYQNTASELGNRGSHFSCSPRR